MASPGWYPDPFGGPKKKFWDGQQWHDGIPAAAGKSRGIPKLLLILAGVFAIPISCLAVTTGNHKDTSSSLSSSSSAVEPSPSPTSKANRQSGCGSSGPTCDATPKADGVYKVNGGGFFDVGIGPGWIATPGRRENAPVCTWERLSGPIPNKIEMIIKTGQTKSTDDPIYVHVEKDDSYFWSIGCQPWVRIDRK